MDSDAKFRYALATSDLESLKADLQDCSYVDIESQSFIDILELCIKIGDETAFAKLLTYIPDIQLESRKAADVPQQGFWRLIWDWACLCTVPVIPNTLPILFFYYTLRLLMICSATCYLDTIHKLSGWASDCLQTSIGPVCVWITLRIFICFKYRFLRDVLFDTLDGALVFMWLAIATRFISPRGWLGFYLHEGLYSLTCLSGIQARDVLAYSMPTWRQKYFSIVLGPDNLFAWTPPVKAWVTQINHGDFVHERLLYSNGNKEKLMIIFLEKANFENINDKGGPGHKTLLWAASKGSLKVIQKLLNLGIEVNTSVTEYDPNMFSGLPPGPALFWAAMRGHWRVVKYLLQNGAVPNHPTQPPLIGATSGASNSRLSKRRISRYSACVSYLLLAGADPDCVDDDGRSALSWCTGPGQKPMLDLLLNAGANPDISDKKLNLPIHYAARFENHEIIEALIDKTGNVDAVDGQGTSALTLSLFTADCTSIMALLAHTVSDINSGGGIHGSPLEAAAYYCPSSILRILLEKGADPNSCGSPGSNCLGAVLQRLFQPPRLEDDILCLELLLSHGADPNKRTSDGRQALHIAMHSFNRAEILKILLKHGADVNGVYHSKSDGFDTETTPLGLLCQTGTREDAAMVLLSAGANPNCTIPDGRTPLQAACGVSGSSRIAQELIARGADIATQSVEHHDTALHMAATAVRSDMIKVLLEKGADANARNARLKTPLHQVCCWESYDKALQEEEENHFKAWREKEEAKNLVESIELLLTRGQADPRAKSIIGSTPLHHAMKARIWLSVETLIKNSPRDIIFEPDSKGRLPLHWAAAVGFTKALHYLIDISSEIWCEREFQQDTERESFFQAMRDSINTVDNSGDTALHHAAMHGHEKFVAKLRLLGGSSLDLDIQNHKGDTALDLAKKHQHVWLVGALKGRAT